MNNKTKFEVKIKKLNIDSGRGRIVFLNKYCPLISSEGLEGMNRIRVHNNKTSIITTLNIVNSDLVSPEEIGVSDTTFALLNLKEESKVTISHIKPLVSFSAIRAKMRGKEFTEKELIEIIADIVSGRFSDTHVAAFCTACEGVLSEKEITFLTQAMVKAGKQIKWRKSTVVDKHCIGGVPGNRTTVIVIPIIAAFGLYIPKTSSRAITSPSGTADTMEVLAPVKLSLEEMKKVVTKEKGCLVWGGAVSLSPADDIVIQIKREINVDSKGQMIASILSKKIAAGSNCILIDIPVGPTAKVKNQEEAIELKNIFEKIGKKLGVNIKAIITNGSQPIGNGIGPALEAKDIVSVLKNEKNAPQDLREKSIHLAGVILEMSKKVKKGKGEQTAREILETGKAWGKFQAICEAQGGMKSIPSAAYTQNITANKSGTVCEIDNKKLSYLAKLAGAPENKAAGIYLHKHLNNVVKKDEKIFTIHSESEGELQLALRMAIENEIVKIK